MYATEWMGEPFWERTASGFEGEEEEEEDKSASKLKNRKTRSTTRSIDRKSESHYPPLTKPCFPSSTRSQQTKLVAQ